MSNLELKKSLYEFCINYVDNRNSRIKVQIHEIQIALGSETKSSAGDKHETGRAMLQLEREKLGQQLAEAENMSKIMNKVDISTQKTSAALGSLVCTNSANYFLAVSAGEYRDSVKKTYCVSLNTPLGIMLLGKTVGQRIQFNKNEFDILEII